jgi:dynein heavy chain, axonemal
MALLLEKTKSSYFPAFNELYKETCDALEEAQDIDSHLKPLSAYFESLETGEFDELGSFDPMFHTICLLWAHSKFYCRPARIVILLQELNNLIIRRTGEYLEPIDLFKGEPEESMEKIKKTFSTLEGYIKSYDAHKLKVMSYFKNGIPPRDWEFSPKLVFARWEKFMERMNMIRVR